MKQLIGILKYDYLQRTRSYAFLITLCASLAIAYTFVPGPNANYSTLQIAKHVGYYNSAWIGYVTAIMTSIFLSLIGFYLVNSGIKTDSHTRVGQIISSTSISNFKYLLAKMLSNFFVLLTIVLTILIMSIALFFLYNEGGNIELYQFLKPYLLIPIPAMFLISIIAVIFEVLLGKYSVLQNVLYFFLFSFLLIASPSDDQFSLDVFGSKIVTHQFEATVKELTHSKEITSMNIGYVLGNSKEIKKFQFNGMEFPLNFVLSRFLWIVIGIGILGLTSYFFHRFTLSQKISAKKKTTLIEKLKPQEEISISSLPSPEKKYGMYPLLKTEFLLLLRKGKKSMWIPNVLGMVLLIVLPLDYAHQICLPILWFLQVHRLSDLTIKELTHNLQPFAFTSYRPIRRLLVAQLSAGSILILLLSLPLLIRLSLLGAYNAAVSVWVGALFIVMLSATLGMLSKGKKLFEVFFFMMTYVAINGISYLDYFGGFPHHSYYVFKMLGITLLLMVFIGSLRKYRLSR